jgi:hypothetical protein
VAGSLIKTRIGVLVHFQRGFPGAVIENSLDALSGRYAANSISNDLDPVCGDDRRSQGRFRLKEGHSNVRPNGVFARPKANVIYVHSCTYIIVRIE